MQGKKLAHSLFLPNCKRSSYKVFKTQKKLLVPMNKKFSVDCVSGSSVSVHMVACLASQSDLNCQSSSDCLYKL